MKADFRKNEKKSYFFFRFRLFPGQASGYLTLDIMYMFQFVKSREILKREKSILQMSLGGLPGERFTRPPVFYPASCCRGCRKKLRRFDPVRQVRK